MPYPSHPSKLPKPAKKESNRALEEVDGNVEFDGPGPGVRANPPNKLKRKLSEGQVAASSISEGGAKKRRKTVEIVSSDCVLSPGFCFVDDDDVTPFPFPSPLPVPLPISPPAPGLVPMSLPTHDGGVQHPFSAELEQAIDVLKEAIAKENTRFKETKDGQKEKEKVKGAYKALREAHAQAVQDLELGQRMALSAYAPSLGGGGDGGDGNDGGSVMSFGPEAGPTSDAGGSQYGGYDDGDGASMAGSDSQQDPQSPLSISPPLSPSLSWLDPASAPA